MKPGKIISSAVVIAAVLMICVFGNGGSAERVTQASQDGAVTVDLTKYVTSSAATHDCSRYLEKKYDSVHHWDQCRICGKKYNIQVHVFSSNNGGVITNHDDYNTNSYREVCSCGFRSGPFLILHGREWNFRYATRYYKDKTDVSLTDNSELLHITRAQFNEWFAGKTACNGEEYTFWDNMGDGSGLVFSGLPVVAYPKYGQRGTVEQYTGSTGTVGQGGAAGDFCELFKVIQYWQNNGYNDNVTRQGFVDSLDDALNSRSNSHLRGLKDKYRNNVTDSQFHALISHLKGTYVNADSYGYGGHNISCSQCQCPGASYAWDWDGSDNPDNNDKIVSGDRRNYESATNRGSDWGDGPAYAGTCDVCGCRWTGTEAWSCDWPKWNYHEKLWASWYGGVKSDGTSVTQKQKLYGGPGTVYLGNVSVTYSIWNGECYVDNVTLDDVGSGISADICSPLIATRTKLNTSINRSYGAYYTNTELGIINFAYTYQGKQYTKAENLGYSYPFVDVMAPIISGFSGEAVESAGNGWTRKEKITMSGTENYCPTVTVRLFDASNGGQIGDSHTVSVTNGCWSFSEIPSIEASESGHNYYYTVADEFGNTSRYDFRPYKVDNMPPTLVSGGGETSKEWSKTKTVTVECTDNGVGDVSTSLNNTQDYVKASYDGSTYSTTYNLTGDIYGSLTCTILLKDGAGNEMLYALKVWNLDNTAPRIQKTDVTDSLKNGQAVGWNIKASADDINGTQERSGSGIKGYAITKSSVMNAPDTCQTGDTLFTPVSGKYRIWVYDNAENISYKDVNITSDVTYNGKSLRGMDYDGKSLTYIMYNGKRLRL